MRRLRKLLGLAMKKSLIIALVFISFSSFASQLSCQVNQYGIGVKETIEINLNQHFYNESGVKSIIISNIEGHEYTIQTSIASLFAMSTTPC